MGIASFPFSQIPNFVRITGSKASKTSAGSNFINESILSLRLLFFIFKLIHYKLSYLEPSRAAPGGVI
jgi:hypothetical protein